MAEPDSPSGLPDALAEAFEHLDYLSFEEFMELALYAPASGFFATGGGAGRRQGDFVTSPEVGPLFGAVVARYLDDLWDRLSRPTPFTVIEAGAGRGALAIAVRSAAPRCAQSLVWVLVERSAALRERHFEHLEIEPTAPGEPLPAQLDGEGPWFTSTAEMPAGEVSGAVLANELLDNLPFRVLERAEDTWLEVVVRRESPDASRLVEDLVPIDPSTVAATERLAPGATPGSRVPLQEAAVQWVQRSREQLRAGEVVAFDYARTTADLARIEPGEWLRTYRDHRRGGTPLNYPGRQDITADVALDQLPAIGSIKTQAQWLTRHGIQALVDSARAEWDRRAAVGDLAAMRARSVPVEAEALIDSDGLGGFAVMTWSAS